MRYSKQRELILGALRNNPVHPTADYVYALLKTENPALSLGTVYRNLNLLAKEGIIKKIKGVDSSERFDHNVHTHSHFVCERCNAIHDIPLPPNFYDVLAEADETKDYSVNTCEVILRGICKDCKENLGD